MDDIASLLEELLPRIPNHVTLDEICTKLPAKDAIRLSLLNQTWQRATQGRLIFNSRARRHATEALVVLRASDIVSVENWGVVLYSPSEKHFYELPRIPDLAPSSSQFIALDGQLYVVGGISTSKPNYQAMHVLDLAGHTEWEWKQCASMLEPRICFQCGALNGKLYVFGGLTPGDNVTYKCESEVYDPQLNVWSPISPMIHGLFNDRVTSVGEELFVASQGRPTLLWQVYHPLTDEWRLVEPSVETLLIDHVHHFRLRGKVFIAQGKFYALSATFDGILVYDSEKESWANWCSLAYDGLGPRENVTVHPRTVLPLGNELLALASWTGANRTNGGCLFLSDGFSSNNGEVVFSKVVWPLKYERLFGGLSPPVHAVCPIEL